MTLNEETIGAFLGELARQGCSSWEKRQHRTHFEELSRWLQDSYGQRPGGQDAQDAFLWLGQSPSYPDWSVIESRYATLEAFSRWLREGRVVDRSEWIPRDKPNTEETYEDTIL